MARGVEREVAREVLDGAEVVRLARRRQLAQGAGSSASLAYGSGGKTYGSASPIPLSCASAVSAVKPSQPAAASGAVPKKSSRRFIVIVFSSCEGDSTGRASRTHERGPGAPQ
jgi:hypothetical protein